MSYTVQVKKKGQNHDWQVLPEKTYDDLDKLKKYLNKQLTDAADGLGDLKIQIVRLELAP